MDDEKKVGTPSSASEDTSGGPGPAGGDGVDQGPAAPRKLDPPRPWLEKTNGSTPPEPARPEPGAGEDGPQRLEPVRPWLKQNRIETTAPAPAPAAPDRSRVLDPTRPWLTQPGDPTPTVTSASPTPSNAAAVLEPLAAGFASTDTDAADARRRVFGRRTAAGESARTDKEPPRHAAGPGQPSWPIAFETPELADAASALLRDRTPQPVPPAVIAGIAGSDEPADVRPEGRLRKASRWLFEQGPPRVDEPTVTSTDAVAPVDAIAAVALVEAAVADEPVAPEPVSLTKVSPRSDLARRLSALSAEPTIVPIPASVPMRPTIAWDEVAAPAPIPAIAPAADLAVDAVEVADVPGPAEPDAAADAEPPGDSVSPADSVAAAPARPRPRPRPYASAPIRTDDPVEDEPVPAAPHRVGTGIASGAGPSSLVRERPSDKDDFFSRTDDDDPPAGPKEKLVKGGSGRERRSLRWLLRTGVVVAIAVLAAVLLRVYVVAPYYIPSASMEPTLHGCQGCNNDHVLVDKLSYRMHDIHRGDVVVFNRPDTWRVAEKTLIKRVVGLPGDKLRVAGGKLFVNGLVLEESYVNPECPVGSTAEGRLAAGKTYGPVPAGDVFVMGDNRCDSSDSRDYGPVPDAKVIGRAFVIIWPRGRIHFL